MIVLSGDGSILSPFIFTPCSTQFTLQREKVQSGPNFQICSAPSGPKSFNYLSVHLRTSCIWNRRLLKYCDFLLGFPLCFFFFFLMSASHLQKSGWILLGNTNLVLLQAGSDMSVLLGLATLLPRSTRAQELRHTLSKKLMATASRKFAAELLMSLNNSPSSATAQEGEGRRRELLDAVPSEAPLLCLFQLNPSWTLCESEWGGQACEQVGMGVTGKVVNNFK